MALVIKDRVKETTTTAGTGTITLAGAVTGFDSFSVIGNANTTYYAIVSQSPGEWEVGIGTYTAAGTLLSRDTVLSSSNAGALVSFSAGTKDVFVTYPAETAVVASDNSGASGQVLTSNGTGIAPTWEDAGGGASAITIQNKTAAYTVVAGDLGTIINCTSGTFTVSLTAAATLGAGFNCWIWNTSTTSSHAITIDPSGAETIDGASTLILRRGEGMQIVCDGTNWQTGDKKVMRGYVENFAGTGNRPIATGDYSIAMGVHATSTTQATTTYAIAIMGSATAARSTAIGQNSVSQLSTTASGAGAMALGGSYASGVDSFAAAVANNTSTYGATGANSITMGSLAKSSNADGIAIGKGALATNGSDSVALGRNALAWSGAVAIGQSGWTGGNAAAQAQGSFAIGGNVLASEATAFALGNGSASRIRGKYAYAAGLFSAQGDAQNGVFVVRRLTSNGTAVVLTTEGSAGTAINQIILPNDSAYAFSGTVVAKQSGSTNAAAWKVEGLIVRGTTAGTTTLVFSTVMAISNVPLWTLALSADTTNGGLAVTATGAAATNIRWVGTIQTSEVTYA